MSLETVPQSMVDTKTIVLRPRLDQGDVQLIGERIKRRLFSRFGLARAHAEDIRFLSCETYFEPYLIIGGKYALDYCKKHVFRVDVDEKTTKVLVGGQQFESKQEHLNASNRVVKVKGEEYAHHERQTYFILDRMKREIQPEKLPISPFSIQEENFGLDSHFKSIQICDEEQIEFLKTRIARRPACVGEIIREVFEITERTIVYSPMYQLTFENSKNQEGATIAVNGITGEIMLNGTKRLAVKTIVSFPESADTQPIRTTAHQAHTQPAFKIGYPDETTNTESAPEQKESSEPTPPTAEQTVMLDFPVKSSDEVPTKGDEVTSATGDLEVPSGATINRNLLVKGTLKIGENCRIHGKLEALKGITVGAETIIDGDLISGGNVHVGPRSLITGSVEAAGAFEIEENAVVEGVRIQTPRSSKSICPIV